MEKYTVSVKDTGLVLLEGASEKQAKSLIESLSYSGAISKEGLEGHATSMDGRIRTYVATLEGDAEELMGTQEVAEYLGWKKAQVGRYAKTKVAGFPAERQRLACGPVWNKKDIAAWASGRKDK